MGTVAPEISSTPNDIIMKLVAAADRAVAENRAGGQTTGVQYHLDPNSESSFCQGRCGRWLGGEVASKGYK